MKNKYWQIVLIITIVVATFVSKSIFLFVVFTWGGLDERYYTIHMWLGNWPSLITGTFTFWNKEFFDIQGIFDFKSWIVNIVGWLPVGLMIGFVYGKWKGKF